MNMRVGENKPSRLDWILVQQNTATLIACLLITSLSQAAQPITTESLLMEMSNRDALARFPSPAFRSVQASSYDRASEEPGTGDWTANRDYSQFLRTETIDGRTEHVMMQSDGPGAIVRIWLTWAGRSGKPFSDGTIRLYLDGVAQPVVAAKASRFIDGGPDANAGLFGDEPFAYGVSPKTPHARRGHNLFVPIPFAKSCKVTYETGQDLAPNGRIDESFYYHVGYRLYESGTNVETFTLDRWNNLIEERETAAERLRGRFNNQNTLPVAGGSDAVAAGEGHSTSPSPALRGRPSRREDIDWSGYSTISSTDNERHWRLPEGPHAIRLIRLDVEFDRWPEDAAELIYTIGPDYGAAEVQIGQTEASIQGRFIGVISVLETRRKKLDAANRERPIKMTVTMQGDGDHPRRFGLDAIVPASQPRLPETH